MDIRLLNKYIAGDVLPEEKEQVIRWMQESEAHREQLMQLHRVYNAALWNGNRNKRQPERKNLVRRYLWASMKVAALVAMLAFIVHREYRNYQWEHAGGMQTVSVPAGQRASLTLSDGTEVWLNSNSTLKYPANGFRSDERKVVLEGEGYFKVAHQAKQPFIVETGMYDIRVLGTTFNVSAYPDSGMFETSLVEGKVTVCHPATQNGIVLKPHEKVEMRDGKLYKDTFVSDDDFLWRRGIYSFRDEPLATVFQKLEQYYEVEIINKNKEIASQPCTGKFRQKEGIEHVMKVLQKYVKFNYMQDDEKNRIIIY